LCHVAYILVSALPGRVDDVSSVECDVDSLVAVNDVVVTVVVVNGPAVQTFRQAVTGLSINTGDGALYSSNKKQHLHTDNGCRMPGLS